MGKKEAREKAIDLLDQVGIPDPQRRFYQYPFELSGGMRQRVMIAVALACGPRILIADEPAAALDAPLQAQIMALLLNMTRRQGLSLILIFHNLQLLRCAADRAVILQAGRTVEEGAVPQIFDHPQHPCTQALINAALSTDPERARQQLLRSACSADP